MVVVGVGSSGSAVLKTNYPVVEGLVAGTTKLPLESSLKPEESFIPERSQVGM